jgi:excisionase family DNA binding protein
MKRAHTVPEAAEICGVSPRLYYAALARGEVPGIRIGRRLVVPAAALEAFLGGPTGGSVSEGVGTRSLRRAAS